MKRFILKILLILGAPLTFISAVWLKFIKSKVIEGGSVSDKILMSVGMLPVIEHYYEPMINPKKHLKKSLRDDRDLPGINLNTLCQLDILNKFCYQNELLSFPFDKCAHNEYYYNNEWYSTGDSEYLYSLVRYLKPKQIFEIGSGLSTLMVRNAVAKNQTEEPDYNCRHICIEPYECGWLEELENVEIIRKKVEDVEIAFFKELQSGDVLFIDSSHVIRPQGDVLYEFLEILPNLSAGVIVHIHDIFTPKDYIDGWVYRHSFWNEQYLLEAFLSNNDNWEIIGATNYLAYNHKELFSEKFPLFARKTGYKNLVGEPRAFWIRKIK
ncbi:MAG: class I SAM-dependent methyltransferase [Candidatus Kapabacteria bacterium]|nr:class I SAM-dependent methyltransferase [Ignavibacteriota bacterium]MCW5884606.1 class I SAM-dependent methyltransferase [Candidatus Kapabacteria bacterium]